MAVRAKFECTEKRPVDTDGEIVDVTFEARYGKDGSNNAEWSKWTPSGKLYMQVTNPPAHNQFEVGKSYFIDITPA